MPEPTSDEHRGRAEIEALTNAIRGAHRALRAVPGVREIESAAGEAERFLLRELNRRLEEAGAGGSRAWREPPPAPSGHPTPSAEPAGPGATAARPSLAERMRELLRRSMNLTPAESLQTLHEWLLGQLVPDEARILSALSDDSSYPMVHIAESGVGTYQRRILENASNVGRRAGVSLPNQVPGYVSHMRRIGLIETGPEDESIEDEYEILLSDEVVRAAINAAGRGPRGARVIRRTIRITALGRELWAATRDEALAAPVTTAGSHPDREVPT